MRRPFPWLCLLTGMSAGLAVGCAEPFDARRQVLGPPRIAALGVVDGVASAALWAGAPMHESAPMLRWTLDGEAIGEGWDVGVAGEGALGLTAVFADGTEREAVVSVAEAPPTFSIRREAVDLTGRWTLEDRAAAPTTPLDGHVVEPGLAARLSPEVSPGWAVRWMLAAGHGTVLQLDDAATDLLREDLEFEDGELASRGALAPGLSLALALALDGAGSNRWSWVGVPMGVEGAWVAHGELRLDLPDADTTTGLLAATVRGVDARSGTLELDDLSPVDGIAEQDELACLPVGQPFSVELLHSGRCAAEDVQGARVVLEVR